jgi:hypothetical protein
MHQISFRSLYYFGDWVRYESKEFGIREGQVTDITLSDDGAVHYGVRWNDGLGEFGIYPDRIQLLAKASKSSE